MITGIIPIVRISQAQLSLGTTSSSTHQLPTVMASFFALEGASKRVRARMASHDTHRTFPAQKHELQASQRLLLQQPSPYPLTNDELSLDHLTPYLNTIQCNRQPLRYYETWPEYTFDGESYYKNQQPPHYIRERDPGLDRNTYDIWLLDPSKKNLYNQIKEEVLCKARNYRDYEKEYIRYLWEEEHQYLLQRDEEVNPDDPHPLLNERLSQSWRHILDEFYNRSFLDRRPLTEYPSQHRIYHPLTNAMRDGDWELIRMWISRELFTEHRHYFTPKWSYLDYYPPEAEEWWEQDCSKEEWQKWLTEEDRIALSVTEQELERRHEEWKQAHVEELRHDLLDKLEFKQHYIEHEWNKGDGIYRRCPWQDDVDELEAKLGRLSVQDIAWKERRRRKSPPPPPDTASKPVGDDLEDDWGSPDDYSCYPWDRDDWDCRFVDYDYDETQAMMEDRIWEVILRPHESDESDKPQPALSVRHAARERDRKRRERREAKEQRWRG